MIISAPGLSTRDHLRDKMEEILRKWGTQCPQEVLDFDKQMRTLRKAQDRQGFSKGGTQSATALYGEIPVKLHNAISRYVGSPDWHHDPGTRKIFWELFQVGKIRKGAGLPTHD